jgi:hypothetical protein
MKPTYIIMGLFSVVMLLDSACSRKLSCSHIQCDTEYYRASGEAYSTNQDLAYEKALHSAKNMLVREISKDIHEKSGAGEQLLNKTLSSGLTMKEMKVVCKHIDKHKGSYRCSVALEINKKDMLRFYD